MKGITRTALAGVVGMLVGLTGTAGAAAARQPEQPAEAAKPDAPNAPAQRALIEAIKDGDAERARRALEDGATPGGPGGASFDTALELALMRADAGVTAALAEHGGRFAPFQMNGWNALELALYTGTTRDVVKRLLDEGVRASSRVLHTSPLGAPAAIRDASIMRELLATGLDPNEVVRGYSPLGLAAWKGTAESVRALLEAGADVRQPQGNGRRPLFLAVLRFDDEAAGIVAALKEGGADLNEADDSGTTPLGHAMCANSESTVRALLKAGVSADSETTEGTPALTRAATCGTAALVRAMLEAGASPDLMSEQGMTALNWALRGADPSTRWQWGRGHSRHVGTDAAQLIMHVRQADPAGMIRALLDAGADPNLAEADWNPLAVAAGLWNLRTFEVTYDGPGKAELRTSPRVIEFYDTADPVAIVELLVTAGAVRKVGGADPDPMDIALRRGDRHGLLIVEALKKAPVKRIGPEPLEREAEDRRGRPPAEPVTGDGRPRF